MALSAECRTCNQETEGSSTSEHCCATLYKFFTLATICQKAVQFGNGRGQGNGPGGIILII